MNPMTNTQKLHYKWYFKCRMCGRSIIFTKHCYPSKFQTITDCSECGSNIVADLLKYEVFRKQEPSVFVQIGVKAMIDNSVYLCLESKNQSDSTYLGCDGCELGFGSEKCQKVECSLFNRPDGKKVNFVKVDA